MYDIVFLSYHEINADKHWELVKERFPRAMRIKDVDGLLNAHRAAAEHCRTRFFWVVDADNIIRDDFDFSYKWNHRDIEGSEVAVWKASNNINGLEYGYGGIKLLPRQAVLKVADGVTDFTTSISDFFYSMPFVASTTVINSTPFESWKAGFRECVKLSSNIIKRGDNDENIQRLNTWKTVALDVPNSVYCLRGAQEGAEYGFANKNDIEALAKINDWDWLHKCFGQNND